MDTNVYNSIVAAANAHGIEPNAALAIFEVESAGVPFWNINGVQRPPIRWEGHYFYARLTDRTQQALAVAQGLASPVAGAIPNPPSFAARYALLDRAKAINPTAAFESCSWGLGQVMGANWKELGYASVNELVSASSTIDGQVDMVFRFIDTNGLADDLNSHDWTAFKNGYNGKLTNGYEAKIQAAYVKYAAMTSPNAPINAPDDELMQLQKMLDAVGDYKLTVDGKFGDDTKAALRDFQLKNGLTVDGIYGPISKAAVEKAYLAQAHQTINTAGVSTAGVGAIGSVISSAASTIQGFASTSNIIVYICVGLIIIGAAITGIGLYSQWRSKK